MNPYADVLAFMKIGQPESCPEVLQSLDAPEDVQDELITAGITCNSLANRCKKLNHPLAFRARLMLEELGEVLRAMGQGDMEEVADGLVDLEYVTVGTAITLGIPHEECWEEVQRANMAKYTCRVCGGAGCPYRYPMCDLFPTAVPEDAEDGSSERQMLTVVEDAFFRRLSPEDAFSNLLRIQDEAGKHPFADWSAYRVAKMYVVLEAYRAKHRCQECDGVGYIVLRDAQGKIQKPPGWSPPDIAYVLGISKGEGGTTA